MKKLLSLFLVAAWLVSALSAADNFDEHTKTTKVNAGEPAPQFEVTTLDGQKFSLKEQQGKVVLVNFFATWCGPCLAEMPFLESDVWQKHKSKKFAMIALGREHTNEELKPFRQKHGFTFPMAGDVKREIFSRYAELSIPRSVLIDPSGRVVAHVIGYTREDFKALLKTLDAELAKVK